MQPGKMFTVVKCFSSSCTCCFVHVFLILHLHYIVFYCCNSAMKFIGIFYGFVKLAVLRPRKRCEVLQPVCLCVCVCVCVCVSVCPLTYLRNTFPNFTKFCVQVICGRGSILLWQWNSLSTSGFVDDVVRSFHIMGPMRQNRSDDGMFGRVRQVATPLGGRAEITRGRSLLSSIAFF